MAEEKKHDSDAVLGDDPFDDLDTEWIEQDEIDLSLESIGHDPFEDVDMDWMEEEGPLLRLAPEETRLALDEFEAEPDLTPSEEPALSEVDQIAIEQVSSALDVDPLSEFSPLDDEMTPGFAIEGLELEAMPPTRPQATFHFPSDMRWGVAVAAHQVEGDNTDSDWWAWEQEFDHVSGGHSLQLVEGC